MITITSVEDMKKLPDAPGSLVAVIIPGKWILRVTPDEPCFEEVLTEELKSWPRREIQKFLDEPHCPENVKEVARKLLHK